jgi:RNA polymerase sigma factor (sigma-70 family)
VILLECLPANDANRREDFNQQKIIRVNSRDSRAKQMLWRQADTDRIRLRHFIFVTPLWQGEYDDVVKMNSVERHTQSSLATRRSLLSRLKQSNAQESWREFFDTYWRLIYSTALNAGLTDSEAQEVVQETVLTVVRKIKSFRYDPAVGSFKGWLLTTVRWRIADQFRKRPQQIQPPSARRTEASGTATLERVADPALNLDAIWEEEWQRTLFAAALLRVKRQANARHYQMFDLHAVKQWSVDRVAQTLGVSTGQVRLAKHRITVLMRREVARLEKEEEKRWGFAKAVAQYVT